MRIMYISDFIFDNTGVGTQSNKMINGLINYDDIEVVSVGIVGPRFDGFKVKKINDKLKVITTPSYHTVDFFEHVVDKEKIDKIVIITDPRFYFDFFGKFKKYNMPIIYWHVWDNYPVPLFNSDIYFSCEAIGCISKLTYNCVKTVRDEFKDKYPNDVVVEYVPHFLDKSEYFVVDKSELGVLRRNNKIGDNSFVIFFNSVNIPRKNLQLVIKVFSSFVKEYNNSFLIIKTATTEIGFDISILLDYCGCINNVRVIDNNKLSIADMRNLYNVSDCTVNVSHAEGFGLSALESLCCGVPVIINETGGLVDTYNCGTNDIIDKGELCTLKTRGISITPVYKEFISSYSAPYIYDDFISEEQLFDAFRLMYNNRKKYNDLSIRKMISDDTYNNFNNSSVEKMYNLIKNAEVHNNKYFMNDIRIVSSKEIGK